MVGLPGDRASHYIDNSQYRYPVGFGFPQRCQGIRGLAGLAYNNHQRIRLKNRIPVSELAGQIHFHRNARQPFKNIFIRHTTVKGRTTGDNIDLTDRPDLLVGHAQFLDHDPVPFDSGT